MNKMIHNHQHYYFQQKINYILGIAGREKNWQKKNSVERCADMVINLIERSVKNQKTKKDKNIIPILMKFCSNTHKNISVICRFWAPKKLREQIKLIKEKCPKICNNNIYLKKNHILSQKLHLQLLKKFVL